MNSCFFGQHFAFVEARAQDLIFNKKNRQWSKLLQNTEKQSKICQIQATQILKERIKGFFYPHYQLDTDQTFYPRIQVNYKKQKISIFRNILILYGIDFLPQALIKKYFGSFNICIEIINSSNCRIIFQNHEQALAALVCNLKDDEIRKNIVLNHVKQEAIYQQWYEILPYYQFCFEKKLQIRFATDKDFDFLKQNQVMEQKTNSFLTKYLEKKEKFLKFSNFQGRKTYRPKQNNRRSRANKKHYNHQQTDSNSISRRYRRDLVLFSRSRQKIINHQNSLEKSQSLIKKEPFLNSEKENSENFFRDEEFEKYLQNNMLSISSISWNISDIHNKKTTQKDQF